jgi:hypothetical protein
MMVHDADVFFLLFLLSLFLVAGFVIVINRLDLQLKELEKIVQRLKPE